MSSLSISIVYKHPKMDYSYIPGTQAEPFSLYSLHGLPTPDHPSQTSQTDDLQEAFMVCSYPCVLILKNLFPLASELTLET